MSLNSVVNNLVRAAAGIPADISDKDLDQHVAELLAKEAKEREMKWSEIGLGGLLGSGERGSPDPNAPKPNKRFLASVIRTVDNHNSSVIRQQLEAAETARSNSGLGESSRSAASRLFGGAMRDAANPRRRERDRDRGRPYDRRGRRELEKRDERYREEERWHDKRTASRERRTRYDIDEEEELYNRGDDTLAGRKEKRDWIKRKTERDRRRREAKEDEESERRRQKLYGDDETEDQEIRRSRRREEDEDEDDRRRRRRERRNDPSELEDDHESERKRRRRRNESPEEDAKQHPRKDKRQERTDQLERSPTPPASRDEPDAMARSYKDTSPHASETAKRDRHAESNRTSGKLKERSSRSRRRRHSPSPPTLPAAQTSRQKSPTPGPSPPPPPDDAPPPPDSPPPPPPPPGGSKMDKYFTADYDPRLDLGDVPREGYVPEVGWDNMLAILKERGKKPRNRSPGLNDDPLEIPKVHLRRTPSPTLKEIEKAERRAKRAARGFDDDFETEAERAKRKAERKKEKEERARVTQLGPGDGGGLFDVSYVKKGGVREWDVGK